MSDENTQGVPAGYVLVPVELLNDAAESIDDYRAGVEFGRYDRKVLGKLKAALLSAAPQAQPVAEVQAAEPVNITAVGEIKRDSEDQPDVSWYLEGGLYELPDGVVLLVADKAITDDCGHGEVYTQAPVTAQAQPVVAGTASDFVRWAKAQPSDREPTTIDEALAEFLAQVKPAQPVEAEAVEDLMTKIQAFGLACYQHEAGAEQIAMQDEIRADLIALRARPVAEPQLPVQDPQPAQPVEAEQAAAPAPEAPASVIAFMAVNREGEARFTDNSDAARELESYGWAITPLTQTPAVAHPQPAQPVREPMSIDAIREAINDAGMDWHNGWTVGEDSENRYLNLCRAIERHHGIDIEDKP